MSSTAVWIVVAVAVALLVALAVGLVVARRRRISLTERRRGAVEAPRGTAEAPPARPPAYRAGGAISFTSGAPPAPARTETDGQPGVGDDASVPRDTPRRDIVQVELPDVVDGPVVIGGDLPPAPPVSLAPPVAVPDGHPVVDEPVDEPVAVAPATDAPVTDAPVTDAPVTDAPVTDAPVTDAPVTDAPVTDAPVTDAPVTGQAPPQAPPARPPSDASDASPVSADPAVPDVIGVGAPGPLTTDDLPPAAPVPLAPTAPPAPVEVIDPTSGRLVRLRGRLSRSRSAFGQGLLGLLGAGDLDEESWEEVEDTLLLADLGASTTTEIVGRLRTELATRAVRTPEQARAVLHAVLVDALRPDLDRAVRALPHPGRDGDGPTPGVVLVAGVNGTGKTTTTGKLARVLVADGRRVLLGAADTFRAAAAEQLATWGERSGAEVVRGAEGADPASVAFEAVKRGSVDGVDTVLIDTAGRLHTKTGLMDELGKVKRVVSRQTEVDEVLLVLDATTGQNGLTQARVFGEVVDVTGIVLTKLDGTAKGGIVFQVQRELGVPVKLVGLGEGPDDLAPFEPAAFVDALLG